MKLSSSTISEFLLLLLLVVSDILLLLLLLIGSAENDLDMASNTATAEDEPSAPGLSGGAERELAGEFGNNRL